MNNVNTIQNEVRTFNVFVIIANFYSCMLEQTVTISQAKALTNAQCAFFAFVMPVDLGYLYRILAMLWFVLALLQCRSRFC